MEYGFFIPALHTQPPGERGHPNYQHLERQQHGYYAANANHAPLALQRLSEIHKAKRLSPSGQPWFRAAQLTLAAIFIATALIGVIMALGVIGPVWLVRIWLVAGTGIPALVALAALR